MKKIISLAVATLATLTLNASESFEKQGFLTTKWCAENGYFKDCRLETNLCGYGDCFKDWQYGDKEKEEIVLYVHDERKYYNIDSSSIKRYLLDEGMHRNEVTIIGQFDDKSNTIIARDYKSPPPPKKSFFKGCL
ncbi:MAG: hypothetical protein HXX81_04895 [Campylobacterales bacterium]|nr:hypothetical protein [Campylobacterales bacterium]